MRTTVLATTIGLCVVGLVAAGCGASVLMREFAVPSSSMEPTLACAPPQPGCLGPGDDHVVVQVGKSVKRGDIVVFHVPRRASMDCGSSNDVAVKRIVGLPGETISEDKNAYISVNGKRLAEPYVSAGARQLDHGRFEQSWTLPAGSYFVLGDNRSESCDSRVWGSLPSASIIGPVVKIVHATEGNTTTVSVRIG
jgi:signal peptidase I